MTISNLSGGDASQSVLDWVHALSPSRILVIEFPCLDIPRLVHRLSLPTKQLVEHNMNEFMSAWANNPGTSISSYIHPYQNGDYLLINPHIQQEQSTFKLFPTSLQLYFPLSFQKYDTQYDYIIFVTQGTLSHPMTLLSLRIADAIILCSTDQVDQTINEHIQNDRFLTYEVQNHRVFSYLSAVSSAQKTKQIQTISHSIEKLTATQAKWNVPVFQIESSRLIDPIRNQPIANNRDHSKATIFSLPVQENQEEPGQLSFLLEMDVLPSGEDPADSESYFVIKQLLCSYGIQSANYLCRVLGIRKQRVLHVYKVLAEEGMIAKLGEGKGYRMVWSTDQMRNYLTHAQPVPAPVLI